VLFANNNISSV